MLFWDDSTNGYRVHPSGAGLGRRGARRWRGGAGSACAGRACARCRGQCCGAEIDRFHTLPGWCRGRARHVCAPRLEAARAAGACGAGAWPLLSGAGEARPGRAHPAAGAPLRTVDQQSWIACQAGALALGNVPWSSVRPGGPAMLAGGHATERCCPSCRGVPHPPRPCPWRALDAVHPQVACGDGLVRIYNFLRSDEPSQYPKVGPHRVEGGWLAGRQGGVVRGRRACGSAHQATTPCSAALPLCGTRPSFTRCLPPAASPQDRMDRSKQVAPADVTTAALDRSDPVAGAPRGVGAPRRPGAAGCSLPVACRSA